MLSLPKHEKYRDVYRPGDLFWGLGIELETYVELEGGAITTAEFIEKNHKPERYSVDYWKIYKYGAAESVIQTWIDGLPDKKDSVVKLPLLLNGHSFSKTDRFSEPQTVYSKTPFLNKKFCGKTLLEDLVELEPSVFKDGKEIWWVFDGDTVELITQDFYNTCIEDVFAELMGYKSRWLAALQTGLDKLPDRHAGLKRRVCWPAKNHGLAVFLTNPSNVAIFNNGTYHINVTLPTYLDKDAKIADMTLFEAQHMRVARLFQWLTPFLIGRFGSADVFASLGGTNSRFPRGSQRCCASRYVSAGTFDTMHPMRGKQLLVPYVRTEGRWYELIYDKPECAYTILPAIGLDINYQKHWNHGLEFRIFDWFSEKELMDVLRLIVWMCDEGLCRKDVFVPQTVGAWNSCLSRAVWEGGDSKLNAEDARVFSEALGVKLCEGVDLKEGYMIVWEGWRGRWNGGGPCTSRMIRTPLSPAVPIAEVRVANEVVSVGHIKKLWCC